MIESSLNAIPLGQRKQAIPYDQRGQSWREAFAEQNYKPNGNWSIPNQNNEMKDKNTSRYIIEDVYMSRQCRGQDHPNYDDNSKNPHNAYQDGKRYYFDFSPYWFNENTLNKAIGLRRIETRPRAYNFKLQWTYQRNDEPTFYLTTYHHITPEDDIETALSRICTTWNRALTEYIRNNNIANPEQKRTMFYTYDEDTYTAELTCSSQLSDMNTYSIELSRPLLEGDEFIDFNRLMNIPTDLMPDNFDITILPTLHLTRWTFENVWNRRDLFIHASFVNYTTFQYLGRNGEFYMKPSKLYEFKHQPIGFYFEVSFDGMKTVELLHENFIVELCLILDVKKYQSQ
jgi:hypothetical protein